MDRERDCEAGQGSRRANWAGEREQRLGEQTGNWQGSSIQKSSYGGEYRFQTGPVGVPGHRKTQVSDRLTNGQTKTGS